MLILLRTTMFAPRMYSRTASDTSAHIYGNRLFIAIGVSLLLHGLFINADRISNWLKPHAQPITKPLVRTVIQATLMPPPVEVTPPKPEVAEDPDSFLHNTLDDAPKPNPVTTLQKKAPDTHKMAPQKSVEDTALQKIYKRLVYPEAARTQHIEGEVNLLLVFDSEGKLRNAEIASSSGHPILDDAALKAALEMGKLPNAINQELILTVKFRLR